jgi:uncharacterized membrane protein HdeD (DUF308 family)
MRDLLAKNWRMVAARGALGLIASLIAFFAPVAAVMGLVMLVGAYVLIDGVVACAAAASRQGAGRQWWVLVAEGLLGIVAGLIGLFVPIAASIAFVALFSAWAIMTGVVQIAVAIRLRREIDGEWLLGAAGAASILTGLLFMAMPGAGLVAIAWIFGAYCAVFGGTMLALAFRLRERGMGGKAALGMDR